MPERDYTSFDEVKSHLGSEMRRPSRRHTDGQGHLKLQQLELLLAVADHGSTALAAHAAGVTSAYLPEIIAHLEKELNLQLVEGSRRALTLTAAGKAFAEHARQLLKDEAEMMRAVTGRDGVEPTPMEAKGRRKHHLNLRQVEMFVEAARHENLGMASRSIRVSSAYMSEAIADLERNLGDIRLLERDTHGSKLTYAGRILAERGEHLLRNEAAARAAVAHVAESPAGEEAEALRPVSIHHRRNAAALLVAVQFIEQHAAPEYEGRLPTALAQELKTTLAERGDTAETIDRMALILDLMQASVSTDEGWRAMLEPSGRASQTFRALHDAPMPQADRVNGEERPHGRQGR